MSSKTHIQPYLFFSGRCDEAIAFYGKAIGATVDFLMRFNESPDATPPGMLQEGFEKKVMHATIRIGGATMMVSDGCDDKSKFDGFRIALALPTAEEVHKAFAGLSEGGQVQMPPGKTFWSPCFGMVVDKFGVGWMVSVADSGG